MTQLDRVLAALRDGPLTVSDITLMTGMRSKSTARAVSEVVALGLVVRVVASTKRGATTYALRKNTDAHTPAFRGEVAKRAEGDYVAARQAGADRNAAAAALRLTTSTAEDFEESYRFQTGSGLSGDSSCPKFAEHDRHLAAVCRLGFYPVLPRLAELRAGI